MRLPLLLLLISAFSMQVLAQTKSEKKSIYYESNVFTLTKDQKVEIELLLDQPNMIRIELYGHADTVGNVLANQKISEQRVNEVKDYIINNHTGLLVITKAHGEKHDDHSNLQNQRRVDIIVYYSPEQKVDVKKTIEPKRDSIKPIEKPQNSNEQKTFNETLMDSDRIVIENLLFEPGKTEFLHGRIPNELFYLAELMDSIPSLTINIEGHVCCVDDMKLSKERAKTVYLFLRVQGIEKHRMTYEGFSNSKPRVEELTKEYEKYNRRVEIVVTGK